MTENYTPPATWQRWADEGGTMAILTVQESADMLKRVATEVMGGEVIRVSPSYARAILDVLAALEDVTAERDALKAQLDAVPESRDDMEDKYFGSMIDDERDPYP